MARDWYLIASLQKLRDEFNNLAPSRDKTSDGSIGDAAHQASQSDHNPDSKGAVHAIDVDRDLRQPGVTMEQCVQYLLAECRAGRETRLKYIIFNRRIWSASSGWVQKSYTGANPHDHHAHFSGKYDSASESSVRSYGLEEEFMAVDYDKIRLIVREEVDRRLDQVAAPAVAPSAEAIAEKVWGRFRGDVKFGWSDTAVNRLEAEITEAIVAGIPVERYPNNPKS